MGGSDSAFVSTAAELNFNRNPASHPPRHREAVQYRTYSSSSRCVVHTYSTIGTTLFRKVLLVAVLVEIVHADLAMHATLAALGTLPHSMSL